MTDNNFNRMAGHKEAVERADQVLDAVGPAVEVSDERIAEMEGDLRRISDVLRAADYKPDEYRAQASETNDSVRLALEDVLAVREQQLAGLEEKERGVEEEMISLTMRRQFFRNEIHATRSNCDAIRTAITMMKNT